MCEPDSEHSSWGMNIFDVDGLFSCKYYGDSNQHNLKIHEEYTSNGYYETPLGIVDSDDNTARALPEEFSRLSVVEAPELLHGGDDEYMQGSNLVQDYTPTGYYPGYMFGPGETDEVGPSSSCSSPGDRSYDGEEFSYDLEITDESELDGEVDKRLNLLIPLPSCGQLKAMKWFYFCGRKDEVTSTIKPISVQISGLTDFDARQLGCELNSQNASDTSSESRGRNQLLSLSERPNNLRVFSFSDLKVVTKNFTRSTKLGEGGFGCVYKAALKNIDDPSTKSDVAIKQLGRRGLQGHKEWVTEVNVLGVVEHPNLVKLIGYCAEDDERGIQRLLIYEYMPNGSIEDHLSAKSTATLSWIMRLKIARDAARGLAYLHEEMDFQIIFRDFKSSNILLDEQWNAKLSDFGMARLGPLEGLTHVSTAVVGTMGYSAPEYVQTGRLTSKSDVWSYGVFLYELITGRRPFDRNRPKREQTLLEWVKPHLTDAKKFQQILDPRLVRDAAFVKSAHKLSFIANRCLSRQAKTRPKMSEVVEMLDHVIESSGGIIGCPEPLVKIVEQQRKITSSELKTADEKSKKRSIDVGWLVRIFPSKLVKS